MTHRARIGAALRALCRYRDALLDITIAHANEVAGMPTELRDVSAAQARQARARLVALEQMRPTTWGRYPRRGALP